MIRTVPVVLIAIAVWICGWNLAFHHLTQLDEVLIGLPAGLAAGAVLLAVYDND